MIRRPPRSTLFPTRRSSDLRCRLCEKQLPSTSPCVAECRRSSVGGSNRLPNKHCGSPALLHRNGRSEEHTSELQSQSNLVCRLLLEKKNIQNIIDRFTSYIY